MGVGRRIKSVLRDKGMTIKQLSENSGISLNTLYSITKRDSTRVDSIILQRIADTLHVHVFDLTDVGDILDSVEVHWSVEKDGHPLSESEFPDGLKDLLSKDIRTVFDSLSPVERAEALEVAFSHQLSPDEVSIALAYRSASPDDRDAVSAILRKYFPDVSIPKRRGKMA